MNKLLALFIKLSLRGFSPISVKYESEENFVICPLAIYKVLTTLFMETPDELKDEINNFLSNLTDIPDINITSKRMIEMLTKYKSEFKMYTLLFHTKEVVTTFLKNFDSSCFLDNNHIELLQSAGAKHPLNKSVSRQTNKVLENVTDYFNIEDLPMLFSTAILQDEWKIKFNPENTELRDFRYGETTVPVKMMSQTGKLKSLSREDYQAVILPYKYSKFMFLGVMPSEDVSLVYLQSSLASKGNLNDLIDEFTESTLKIEIPVFEIETEFNIRDNLKELGVKNILESTKYPGIARKAKIEKINLRQKSKFIFNENGTIEIKKDRPASSETNEQTMTFDRPFFFYIIKEVVTEDQQKHFVPFFMGAYFRPQDQ